MPVPQIARTGIRYLHSILLVLALLGNADRIDAQRPTTDPRERDSDKDGYPDGPNHWLVLPDGEGGTVTYLVRGEDFNGNGKYEPLGDDGVQYTIDDESNPRDPRSRPIRPVQELDSDRDGLGDAVEEEARTDPFDRDSDDDGLLDGDEYYGIGLCYAQGRRYRTSAMHADSDRDWLPDGVELGVFGEDPTYLEGYDVGSTDRDCTYSYFDDQGVRRTRSCYTPDADEGFAGSFTDPFVDDTNGNGRREGQDDRNLNGRFDSLGEDGVPSDDDESDPAVGIWLGGANKANYFPFDGVMEVFFEESGVGDSLRVHEGSRRQRLRFHWGSSAPEVVSLTLRRLDGSEPVDVAFESNGGTSLEVEKPDEAYVDFAVLAGDDGVFNGPVKVAWANAASTTAASASSGPGVPSKWVSIPLTRLAWNRLIGNFEGNRVKVEISYEQGYDMVKALDLAFGFDPRVSLTGHTRYELETWSIAAGHGGLPVQTVNEFYAQFGIRFYTELIDDADRNVGNVNDLIADFYVLNAPDLRSMVVGEDGSLQNFADNCYHFENLLGSPFADLDPSALNNPRSCEALGRFRAFASTFWRDPDSLKISHEFRLFPIPDIPFSTLRPRGSIFAEAVEKRELRSWNQVLSGSIHPDRALSLDLYVYPYFGPDVYASTGPTFGARTTLKWNPVQGQDADLFLISRDMHIHYGTFFEGAADAAIMPELSVRPYPASNFTNAITHEIGHYLGLNYHVLYSRIRDLSSESFDIVMPPAFGYMPDTWFNGDYIVARPVMHEGGALNMRLATFLVFNPQLRGNACLPKSRHFGFEDEVGQLMSPFDMWCDWMDGFDVNGRPQVQTGLTEPPVVHLSPPVPLRVQAFDRIALTIQRRYFAALGF